MIRRSALTAIFASASVSVSAAQAPAQVAQSKVPQAKVRLLAFSPEQRKPEVYAHDPAAAADTPGVKVEIKNYLNHESYLVATGSKKVVFTTKPDHASIGRPGELIGEVSLPATSNSSILVFFPGKPDGKAANAVMAVDDSKRAFPAGSFLVINVSPHAVKLKLEKVLYDCIPGKTLLISKPPEGENYQARMEAYVQKGNEWTRIAAGIWPVPEETRNLSLLYLNPATGQVCLRGFDDIKPADEPSQGTASASPQPVH